MPAPAPARPSTLRKSFSYFSSVRLSDQMFSLLLRERRGGRGRSGHLNLLICPLAHKRPLQIGNVGRPLFNSKPLPLFLSSCPSHFAHLGLRSYSLLPRRGHDIQQLSRVSLSPCFAGLRWDMDCVSSLISTIYYPSLSVPHPSQSQDSRLFFQARIAPVTFFDVVLFSTQI